MIVRMAHSTVIAGLALLAGGVTIKSDSAFATGAGLLICLALPGHALIGLLFPGRQVTWFERVTLTPALSLAAVVLCGLLAYWAGFKLTPAAWAMLLTALTLAAVAGSEARAFIQSRSGNEPEPANRMRFRIQPSAILLIAVTGAVLAGSLVYAHDDSVDTQPRAATSIAMVHASATGDAASPTREVSLGIWNGEGRDLKFSIKLSGPNGFTQTIQASVFRDSAWSGRATVPAHGRVTAELFRPGDTEAYRLAFQDEP